jgi:hypothetical protein
MPLETTWFKQRQRVVSVRDGSGMFLEVGFKGRTLELEKKGVDVEPFC